MFRKPKSKNIRQRARVDSQEDDNDSRDVVIQNENNKMDVGDVDDDVVDTLNYNFKKVNSESVQDFTQKSKKILSFAEDEDDDISDFKLKRHSNHGEKCLKKRAKSTSEDAIVKSEAVKKEEIDEEILIVKQLDVPTSSKSTTLVEEKRRRKVEMVVESDECPEFDSDTRSKFSSTFTDIPDAKAVYEARKKRELMRRGGGEDFIPLDDTVRLKDGTSSRSGERSRLIREDENDLSDDECGKFYSKNLLITEEEQRRTELLECLRVEQGESDEEDRDVHSDEDELAKWESDQIRKGVSMQKVNRLQEELQATSMFYRGTHQLNADGTVVTEDMDIEIVDTTANKSSMMMPDGFLSEKSSAALEEIVERIQLEITRKQECLNGMEDCLKKLNDQIYQNQISIGQLTADLEARKTDIEERKKTVE